MYNKHNQIGQYIEGVMVRKIRTHKIIINTLLLTLIPLLFVSGFVVGNFYNITNILCTATEESYVLETEFKSDNGIIIPQGTVVPLRSCEYIQRINYQFAIDKSVNLKKHTGHLPDYYGFAEIYPATE